jgi:hypothetical protein
MPWARVSPQRQEGGAGETVTIRAEGKLAFSSRFIFKRRLEEFPYVEVFVDDELHRIGFQFHLQPTAATVLLRNKDRGGGRLVAFKQLLALDWCASICDRAAGERRFAVEVDESVANPSDGIRYFITIS